MKVMHLSDLHLGKRLNGYSLIKEQEYVLNQALKVAKEQQITALILAGDIYDQGVPTIEAVELLDNFLKQAKEVADTILIVSGNHDSAERLSFASEFMKKHGVYISPAYKGEIPEVVLEDEYGEIVFHLLPFIKPAYVRGLFHEPVKSYTEAVDFALRRKEIDTTKRNVLIAHQFVTGATRSESEDITVGTLDNVNAAVFDEFDYVALGHVHKAQHISRDTIRYSGTLYKYSFSEVDDQKSVTIADFKEKGVVDIQEFPITPKRDLRHMKGTYAELMDPDHYMGTNTDDYVYITLTDEHDIPEVVGKLRSVYPNLMKLDYDNTRTKSYTEVDVTDQTDQKNPIELFHELFVMQNGIEMSKEQDAYHSDMMKSIWETPEETQNIAMEED